MGKNLRRQLLCRDDFHEVDVSCDSAEEVDFVEWCAEAAQLGIIQDFEYQPKPIQLFDAVDYVNSEGKKRQLFKSHVYSPDFKLTFAPQRSLVLCKQLKLPIQAMQQKSFQAFLDVKGTFLRNDGGRAFSINQKWVYQKTGIYVAKVVPKDFFKVCGCPQKCFMTKKTGKPRKMYIRYKGIAECNNRKSQH